MNMFSNSLFIIEPLLSHDVLSDSDPGTECKLLWTGTLSDQSFSKLFSWELGDKNNKKKP